MTIRERIYENEKLTLCEFAMLSKNTRGRVYDASEDNVRTDFMRDRDRIIHCKSFRRLKDKTQVFLIPEGSHYRTRLTHTLEVSQIARTISRALRLNDDLTEAIALGHDLGHTPFGHAGERSLNEHVPFTHNAQSLRIVEKLENDSKGLNLTYEVRDGIFQHKKGMHPCTLEGMAVNMADRIAYLNHDIDDALRAGVLTPGDIPADCVKVLGDTYSARINTMTTSIIENSLDRPFLKMGDEVGDASDALRKFMFEHVYTNNIAKSEETRVPIIIDMLFKHYQEHFDEIPPQYAKNRDIDGRDVCIADYIAGMTDKFAVNKFEEIYIPHGWRNL